MTFAGHPVFQGRGDIPQTSPDQQLILFLYRMGHSGNASPLRQISETFGVSQGHVVRCTARVLEAILDTPAITNAISLPAKGSAEREDAKRKMARVSSHFDPDVSTLKASAYLRRRWMFVTSGHAMAGGLLPWKG
ncbi:hypothetical protein C343_03411 [Cryptococcus neoformans C23]|uniref:Uncharacterized protein n=1 Tax=Cryptococcus neoformans Tu259-1 TaxID=1230072 RepID=A0A854QCW9_CRYNE|nr:hypothetical protein C347_03474 [Cryptococcus neoformans var. grubii AD2-60a]OWZ42516.1 hypothetical protein C353_03317 [Cryptococcus neoformans var. grubii AD1-83a]OWZ43547.1 hypothetical protein C343_03411 [Cryptococcus neoformans var. grubii C23]OWZ54231.1 hypothetical protein C368_03370 [Cryptococcus neoformans var. grubii 125.91]OXC84464.1 hypothetical protein C344_03171 [Cryptococcus neoformans var. grubii AD1-7a]OXG20643.1 hypothetical protein C361_03617 [Cryptococcus neoformans var.